EVSISGFRILLQSSFVTRPLATIATTLSGSPSTSSIIGRSLCSPRQPPGKRPALHLHGPRGSLSTSEFTPSSTLPSYYAWHFALTGAFSPQRIKQEQRG